MFVLKKEVDNEMKPIALSKRLLVICLSIIIVFAVIVPLSSPAYGDNRQEPLSAHVTIEDHDNAFLPGHEFGINGRGDIYFNLERIDEYTYSGTAEYIIEIYQDGGWERLTSVYPPFHSYGAANVFMYVAGAYADHLIANRMMPEMSFVPYTGFYRLKVAYSGDENWLPIETDWYNFTVKSDPDVPPSTPPWMSPPPPLL
jgi:hypothetical protein